MVSVVFGVLPGAGGWRGVCVVVGLGVTQPVHEFGAFGEDLVGEPCDLFRRSLGNVVGLMVSGKAWRAVGVFDGGVCRPQSDFRGTPHLDDGAEVAVDVELGPGSSRCVARLSMSVSVIHLFR